VKQHKQDQGEFVEPGSLTKQDDIIDLYKGNINAVSKIVRIQYAIRRYWRRLKRQQVRESAVPKRGNVQEEKAEEKTEEKQNEVPVIDASGVSKEEPTENVTVAEVEARIGPFKHDDYVPDARKIEKRPPVILDNGAKYLGEWYVYLLTIFQE